MTEPTNWIRNQQPTPVEPVKTTDYKSLIALAAMILGTLLISVGMLVHFGVYALLITLGIIIFIVGLALGFRTK